MTDDLARVKALHARLVAEAEWTRPDPEISDGITVGLDAHALGAVLAYVDELRSAHERLLRDYETRGWLLEMEVPIV